MGELTTFLAEFPAFSGWRNCEGAADEEADDPRDFYTEGGFRLGGELEKHMKIQRSAKRWGLLLSYSQSEP